MATLVLQVAGSVLGAAVGGPFGAIVGRSLGALAGARLDQGLFGGGGGSRFIEGPRLKEIDGIASTEGAPIPRVYCSPARSFAPSGAIFCTLALRHLRLV